MTGTRLRALAGGEPVTFTGYVDDARLDALIAGADLLVHPSLYEGFGLVVLEAMSAGPPCSPLARPRCRAGRPR